MKSSTKHNLRQRKAYAKMPFFRQEEKTVVQQLRLHGIPCRLVASQHKPWDAVTSTGLTIEIKAARIIRNSKKGHLIRSAFWVVAFTPAQRKANLSFVVIRLLGDARDVRKLYLVLRGPIRDKQLQITIRQLLTKYRHGVNRWDIIRKAEQRRRER